MFWRYWPKRSLPALNMIEVVALACGVHIDIIKHWTELWGLKSEANAEVP